VLSPEIWALRDRGGSTITPQLRQLYSGEDLGFGYSGAGKRVIIPEHEYRGVVVAGVQPGKGSVILDDVEGGFPQRWLWLPARDSQMPRERPPEPAVRKWQMPDGLTDRAERQVMQAMNVCARARDEIDAASVRNNERSDDDDSEDLSAHAMYTQLKVAAGLALLDERDSVGEDDWDLAATVMKKSDSVRDMVTARLTQKAHKDNVARGTAEGIRREVADTTEHDRAIKRIARLVLKKMPARPEWISASKLRPRIAARDRDDLPEVLDYLVENSHIEAEKKTYQGQSGTHYRRAAR
jgi:hypothetical protein